MKNPFKKETIYRTVYRANCIDVEEFIQKFYENPEYRFVADMKSPSIKPSKGISHIFGVDGKLDDRERKKVEEFRRGTPKTWMARVLLNDLCRQKIIKPGEYIVDVSW